VTTRQPKVHTQLGRAAVQNFAARIFLANDRMNQVLIEHLDPAAWKAKPPGKSGDTRDSPHFSPIQLSSGNLPSFVPATGSRPRRLHIRPREVLPFEQKRLSFGFRQRIGEAISKIQFGGVPAGFPEVAIGLARYAGLRFGDRLNRDLRRFAPQELTVQFSMTNLETRPNSRVLLVTSVKPRLRA